MSVTLLATIAAQNQWNGSRLTREWYEWRTGVLQTGHNESFAATVEFSLISPTFVNLGPDARRVLEVIAFFPLGVDERKLEWVFPTVSDRQKIIDGLCILSLTYRASGFITMLAPRLPPPEEPQLVHSSSHRQGPRVRSPVRLAERTRS